MERLRVLVGEDHKSMRGILVELLSSDFEVVDSVGDGQQLVEAAVLLRRDLIVSDIAMPGKDGWSARTELLNKGIEIPFVFVTLLDPQIISPGPATLSYIHKSDVAVELIHGVRVTAGGGTYYSRSFREAWGLGGSENPRE